MKDFCDPARSMSFDGRQCWQVWSRSWFDGAGTLVGGSTGGAARRQHGFDEHAALPCTSPPGGNTGMGPAQTHVTLAIDMDTIVRMDIQR